MNEILFLVSSCYASPCSATASISWCLRPFKAFTGNVCMNSKRLLVAADSYYCRLKHLNLGQNKLKSIPPEAFHPLSSLTTLDLSHNLLRTISPNGLIGNAIAMLHYQLQPLLRFVTSFF